jgi:hypothetical protein
MPDPSTAVSILDLGFGIAKALACLELDVWSFSGVWSLDLGFEILDLGFLFGASPPPLSIALPLAEG